MSDPIDTNDDIAVGVSLPLRGGQQGFFNQTMTTMEAAKSNIKNLLLTMKGERPMQPDFGSNLFNSLFEPMVDGGEIEENCKNAITDAIDEWLPYVNIDDLQFTSTSDDKNNNVFRITLMFSLTSDPTRFDELTFTVEGSTGE